MVNRYRVSFAEIGWMSPIPGVRQKTRVEGNQRLRLVEYSREMKPHWCVKGHTGYILDGRFEIEFAEERYVFEAGDGVFIPGGDKHRHRATVLTDTVTAVFVEEL